MVRRGAVAALALLGAAGAVLGVQAWRGDAPAGSGRPAAEAPAARDGEPAAAGYAELVQQLQRRPGDSRALILKARLDRQAERHARAAAGYERALAPGSKARLDPRVWVEYAEARGLAQDGRLAGEPARALEQALQLDARYAPALDLAATAAWEAQDYAGAARHWRRLQEQLSPGTPRHDATARAIEAAEQRARLSLPPRR